MRKGFKGMCKFCDVEFLFNHYNIYGIQEAKYQISGYFIIRAKTETGFGYIHHINMGHYA